MIDPRVLLTPRLSRKVECVDLGWEQGEEIIVRGLMLVHGFLSQIISPVVKNWFARIETSKYLIIYHVSLLACIL